MPTDTPTEEEIWIQIRRCSNHKLLRNSSDLQKLLTYLFRQYLVTGSIPLSEKKIALECFEELPKHQLDGHLRPAATHAKLGQLRRKLKKYFGTDGFRDPIVIKFIEGSWGLVIQHNELAELAGQIDRRVQWTILRIRAAIDRRTMVGVGRAVTYLAELAAVEHPIKYANGAFTLFVAAPIVPLVFTGKFTAEDYLNLAQSRGGGLWEVTFAEAAYEAAINHNWHAALSLFEIANTRSGGQARYYWWYTALLVATQRVDEAIDIVESAVSHFSHDKLAFRVELAVLFTLKGDYEAAEEMLLASLDFTEPTNPLIAAGFVLLYEAQDRLADASQRLQPWVKYANSFEELNLENMSKVDYTFLLLGLYALVTGRMGAVSQAEGALEILFGLERRNPGRYPTPLAIGLIGSGRYKEAIRYLEEAAFRLHDPLAMWFRLYPPLRHLRGEPAFKALIERLHLDTL